MTAVEWLENCLTEQYPNGSFVWNTRADLEALFNQALEMENQQMKSAFVGCWITNVPEGIECKVDFEKWFEQFKNK